MDETVSNVNKQGVKSLTNTPCFLKIVFFKYVFMGKFKAD